MNSKNIFSFAGYAEPIQENQNDESNKTNQNACSSKTDLKSNINSKLLKMIENKCENDSMRISSLKEHLMNLFVSGNSNEMMEGDLLDCLGFENIELVGEILANREEVLDGLLNPVKTIPFPLDVPPPPVVPTGNFVVETSSQLKQRKEIRKEQKRQQKEITRVVAGLGEVEKLEYQLAVRQHEKARLQALKDGSSVDLPYGFQGSRRKLPFVFDASESAGISLIPVGGTELCLPEGSIFKKNKLWEEIYVPPSQKDIGIEIKKIKVSTLDPLGKAGFESIKELNTIQSIVFQQAYYTPENLLICAPTGAGKTNIAMLAVLKTIRDHCKQDGTIDKKEFKIIYIAPMKALAAEMAASFSKRLNKLGLTVKELTGDTVLTKKEISETQMLILTPEKWDVVTRKADDEELTALVKLLIIDEVHLLHDERGPVIETIVARTLRRIQMSQHKVRIVGLSATLPNFLDVATFLQVDHEKGLFFFDGRFRPVPLAQTFIGIGQSPDKSYQGQNKLLDEVCYQKCLDFVSEGHQVLIFVHTRNGTLKTAKTLIEMAQYEKNLECFLPPNTTIHPYFLAKKQIRNAKNSELEQLFLNGFGIHHAGMIRPHRSLMERLFAEGHIRVLVCTATLAWGVNLPAHAVIIKGTEIFDAQRGVFTDIGVLDVQQIFGRAGRPQYEATGHGVILTQKSKLLKYITMLVRQAPIESQLMAHIHDNLNAEIAAGTVSTIDEAVEWLRFTYMYVRAKLSPLAYGINHQELRHDPTLTAFLNDFVFHAAKKLDQNKMIVFDSINGYLSPTDLGRIASHFYVTYETIETLNDVGSKVKLTSESNEDDVLAMICKASEFSQIKARETEMMDLDQLSSMGSVMSNKNGTLATTDGKVNCLLQGYISQTTIANFALTSEMLYVAQNASRIARSYFEVVLRKGWASTTQICLLMTKCIEKRMWSYQTPLRQLGNYLKDITVNKIEGNKLNFYQLLELSAKELGNLFSADGQKIYNALRYLPAMECSATIKPVTGTIIQIQADISPTFYWNDSFHGKTSIRFWIFVEDVDEDFILHYELLPVPKKKVLKTESQSLTFTIPVRDQQMRHQFQVRIVSDSWVVDDTIIPISLHHYPMPEDIRPHTDLLSLDPLPITALKNSRYQSLYSFEFFNPIQTQVFHCLYHTDQNVLIGAPTSSGKTLCAELGIYRVLNKKNDRKCVYIAPLKALVRERVLDWTEKFRKILGIQVVEVSGDHTPDSNELEKAQVLITTPEKWDGITRSWETRNYVKQIDLVVIDEIHLLGVERGAVLEAIVTRLKLIARKREINGQPVRIVGLSTALANAADIAQWLEIKEAGLYNFRPSVRPVPIDVHIQGFPGQHYCPRMALMNKPAFKAIKGFSPSKPTLIFVASRRQTRITAMSFVTMLAAEEDPKQWLHMEMSELQKEFENIQDENLRLTLPFGIGMHHAGLQPSERIIVEKLFVKRKIQVLIATATLAWGINCPAHLVIVKGTEYFDGTQRKYVDFPVTDVLQMIGRAGRPQYDNAAVAVVYVQDIKKNFYKRFLYEPFPVESSLLPVLSNHVNAEICAGTVLSKHQIIQYISGTYFYRRLFANPAYYGVEDQTSEQMIKFLTAAVDNCLIELVNSFCIEINEEDDEILSTVYGRIASNYYLEHITLRHFVNELRSGLNSNDLLKILADCPEYAIIPVRHNEEIIQEGLNKILPLSLPKNCEFESPHVKVYLLYQAHFSQLGNLSPDYVTDLRSILDSCIRILQAMMDVSLANYWLDTTIGIVILLQQIIQGRWYWDHPLLCLPHIKEHSIDGIGPYLTIPELQIKYNIDKKIKKLTGQEINEISKEIMSCTILDEFETKNVVDALSKWSIMEIQDIWIQLNLKQFKIQFGTEKRRIPLAPGIFYKLKMRIQMLGPNRLNTQTFSTRFHKEKTSSWIVLIGNKKDNSLLGFSKVAPISNFKDIRISFISPKMPGHYTLTVFVLSDSYLGIDQEYDISFDVRIDQK